MKNALVVLFFAFSILAFAQQTGNRSRFITIAKKTTSTIVIDGQLDEEDWKQTEALTPFLNKWPLDSGYAEAKSEVRLLFSNDFIYVSAINFQKKEDLVIQTLKRDQEELYWTSEAFSIVLDPIGQKTTGFMFGTNAGGSQYEAAITLMGAWSRTNENWDNKWFSAVKVHDDRWVVEMAIPYTALRFNKDAQEWGINFVRNDMKRNAFSTWAKVPIQFNGMDLGYLGTLRFSELLTPRQSKITLIPYMSGNASRNFEEGEQRKVKASAGLDAKIALSSSMNLDLTYRPDFSNVDVDKQVTNVTRFSIFFPERRNFFLENADLFGNYGSWLVRPFFSRKIGIVDGNAIPIVAGARLTGNINQSLRVGVMNLQTEATNEVSANNYSLFSAQQNFFKRSNIKFFAANRQMGKPVEGDGSGKFNRTFGTEVQLTSENGKFSTSLRAHLAQTPEKLKSNEYISAQVGYNSGKIYGGSMLEKTGVNYINDFGFTPRLYNYDAANDTTIRMGHYTLNPWFGLLIRPNKYGINLIEPNTWSVIYAKANGDFLERMTSVNLTFYFKNTSNLFFETQNNDSNLPVASDIVSSENPLPPARYQYTQFTARYTSDKRKKLNTQLSYTQGGFYNGSRTEIGVTLNARIQPWGSFGVSYLQNQIELPDEYGKADFKLIGPRAEISFRNNLWWTTFLQYNTQAENFNVNSRLQWRFKPMSDLFVVYTDNYVTTNMNVKNRGLVVKLTYWLNL